MADETQPTIAGLESDTLYMWLLAIGALFTLYLLRRSFRGVAGG